MSFLFSVSIVMFMFYLIIRPPPRSTRITPLFPYTTHCRSRGPDRYASRAALPRTDRLHLAGRRVHAEVGPDTGTAQRSCVPAAHRRRESRQGLAAGHARDGAPPRSSPRWGRDMSGGVLVRLDHVTKRFGENAPALDAISATVAARGITGDRKSTRLNSSH